MRRFFLVLALVAVAHAGSTWTTRAPLYFRGGVTAAGPSFNYLYDLRFDNADGTSNWVDNGSLGLTWYSTNGAPHTLEASASRYYSAPCSLSNACIGGKDGVSPLSDDARLELSNSNWTFESWCYLTTTNFQNESWLWTKMYPPTSFSPFILGVAGNTYSASQQGKTYYLIESTGSSWDFSGIVGDQWKTGVWYNLCAERSGRYVYIYTNGVKITTVDLGSTAYSHWNNSNPWLVGGGAYNDSKIRGWRGHVDNARFTMVSKYGGTNYTP